MVSELQPHIQLSKELDVQKVLLPGDPARVNRIKRMLKSTQEIEYNREYKSVTGYYKGTKILVMSTGMGGPSTAIAVEELNNIGVKYAIRIGSCGALQKELKLGDLVIATGAVRDEGTTKTYVNDSYPALPSMSLLSTIEKSVNQQEKIYPHHFGIVRSHDSFYTDNEEEKDNYWRSKGILGADMETASLFVIGSLRGLQMASILNVVVTSEGNLEDGINDFVKEETVVAQAEQKQIEIALEALASLN